MHLKRKWLEFGQLFEELCEGLCSYPVGFFPFLCGWVCGWVSHVAVFGDLGHVPRPAYSAWVFGGLEVGEIRNGKVKLEEYVVPLGIKAGFKCEAIMINSQYFTKTSNVWGIKNKSLGTNTNRIVIFSK